MLQHGKALYNRYDSNYEQFKRPEFIEPKSEFTKNNEDFINPIYKSNVQLDSSTTQLNLKHIKIKQDNQAFKNYMINLCKSYIDTIEFRNVTEQIGNTNELVKLYDTLTDSTKPNSFLGGYDYQRNYTCTFTDTNGKTEVNIKWELDKDNYVTLVYFISVNGSTIEERKYRIGNDDNEGVITKLMNILNPILAQFHNEDLSDSSVYTSFHFNYQVISFLNYYLTKDFDYFEQTKYMLILSTIRYHMNQFNELVNQSFEIKNVITNSFPFMCHHAEFFGDCGLNTIISSIDPIIRRCIIEYFIKDYYNVTNESQQLEDLSNKIRQELNDVFDNIPDLFSNFIDKFKSEYDGSLMSFVNNTNINGKTKVDELAKLYISILLVKAKINHLFNMITRAPKLNLNVLTEAFAYYENHRNCINNIIAEKYDDSNKHYLTLPVALYKIPHAVLLVIERNDVNESNPNDKAYVVDLNDMSILYNQPTSEYKTYDNYMGSKCLSNKPTSIMAKRLKKCGLEFCGVITEYHEIDNRFMYSTKTLSRFYEKYIQLTKYNCRQTRQMYYYGYVPVINTLFKCKIDEKMFSLNQLILSDVIHIIPEPFKTKILNDVKSLNIMNLFTVVVNCFIEYFDSINIIIPWEYIITNVNKLNYSYLFFSVYCAYVMKTSNTKVLVNDCYNIMSNEIEKYDSYMDKLSTLLYRYRNDKNELKEKLDQLIKSNSDEYSVFGIIYQFMLRRVYELLNEPVIECYYITNLMLDNPISTTALKQLKVNNQCLINTIELNQTNPIDSNEVETIVQSNLIKAVETLNCINRLNNILGMPGEIKNNVINPNPIDHYLIVNKYQGGDYTIQQNPTNFIQQLLVFLLVLVIIVVVVVLIVKGVKLISNNNKDA